MIKLKIKDSNEVELDKIDAICNFCGKENLNCVRGSMPSKFTYIEYTTKFKRINVDDLKYCRRQGELSYPLFGKPKVLKEGDWGCFCEETIYSEIVNSKDIVVKEEQVDICFDCITQLAKLIK